MRIINIFLFVVLSLPVFSQCTLVYNPLTNAFDCGGSSSVAAFTDLQVSRTSSTILSIAAGSARIGNVTTAFSAATATLSGSVASSTAYVYVSSAGVLTVGHNGAATITCSGCTTATGVSAFPSDSIPIATATYTSSTWDTSGVTDRRAQLSGSPVASGNGIALTYAPTGAATVSTDSATVPRYSTGSGAPSANCTQGRDFYLDTATSTLYQCTATNTWGAVGTAAGSLGRYYPWGLQGQSGANQTTAFAANETRWHLFQLPYSIIITGVGIRAHAGFTAGTKGLKFAVANQSGTILYKTSTITTCGGGTMCQAAFSATITLTPGSYYLGITTDSTGFQTGQVSNILVPASQFCELSNQATAPLVAGTGTAGSGTIGSVDFAASMGTLTSYPCNSGTNTLIAKFHDMYFY